MNEGARSGDAHKVMIFFALCKEQVCWMSLSDESVSFTRERWQ
jgi:hypothetical protein